jgi:predicted aconitase
MAMERHARVAVHSTLLVCGLRVDTWRDANVLDKVSIHLTLIIKSYRVSRFSAVVTVPHQIAGSRKAKMRQVLVRRETELTSETAN